MRSHLAFSIALAGICLAVVPGTIANANSTSKQTFPEIVRISYLEGDVRVSRTHEGGAPKDTDWEKAVVNLPIQTGFSLATDDGRAEIEFEDSSIVYMAPHSVLIFNDLESTGDAPQSEVALLTGTVTLRVHPRKHDEYFILRTPTDTMTVTNGQRSDMRVTSYMDAIGLTPTVPGYIQISANIMQAAIPGRTHYYHDGKQVDYSDPAGEAALKDWDKWVANRITERDVVMAKMLNKTGLKEPVPGLAQLDGQGKFVDCPGYGTCWEPPTPPAPAPKPQKSGDPNNMSSLVQPEPATTPGTTSKPKKSYTQVPNSGGLGYYDAGLYFPCGPDSMYYNLAMQAGYNPAMMGAYGYGNGYGYGFASSLSPWAWAVCHSGSWIYQQDRYLWVPGGAIQHFPPVHWVKHGGRVGFIPIHPHDVPGRMPINGTHGIISGDKGGRSFARVTVDPGSQLKVLHTEPKEFRKPTDPSLARTESPHMEAHVFRPSQSLSDGNRSHGDRAPQSNAHVAKGEGLNAGGGREIPGRAGAPGLSVGDRSGHGGVVGVPIVFDHNSQNFMMSHEVVSGRSMRTVSEPVGSYLARSGQTFGGHEGPQIGRGGMAGGPGSGFDRGSPGMSSGRGVFPGNGGGSMGGNDGGGFNPGMRGGSGGFSPSGGGGGGGGISPSGNVGGGGPGVSSGGGLSAPATPK